jgi:hypothetical protein
MSQCSASRRDGLPCAARALAGGTTCFFHSGSAQHARARSRGRRQGGVASLCGIAAGFAAKVPMCYCNRQQMSQHFWQTRLANYGAAKSNRESQIPLAFWQGTFSPRWNGTAHKHRQKLSLLLCRRPSQFPMIPKSVHSKRPRTIILSAVSCGIPFALRSLMLPVYFFDFTFGAVQLLLRKVTLHGAAGRGH